MSQLQCKRCLDLKGPGCEATHEDAAGAWVCLFCLDGEICPIQAKRLRDAKKNSGTPPAASGESERPASKVKSEEKMPELRENSTKTAPKICQRPGCETKLSSRNLVGLYRAHVRWTAPGERTSSNGNGHAAGSNGSAEKANGHANALLLEDRLDKLILSFPASAKAKIVDCWIKGVI